MDAAWGAIESLRAHCDLLNEREKFIVGTLLTGGEGTLLGKRVRLHVEWLEGLPGGMTEDDVRRMGEKMLPD